MYFDLDKSCGRYEFCKEMIGFQIATELLLNVGERTSGNINRCEICNLYIEKENKYDRSNDQCNY